MTVARTVERLSATVAWKTEASLARITVGYTTRREIAWKRRQNLPRASFI